MTQPLPGRVHPRDPVLDPLVLEGPATDAALNALSVDVEEHYQVEAFRNSLSRGHWDELESRVEANTRRILRLLERREAKATFFVLGSIAKRCPGLIRECAGAGHEIASHGWDHRPITEMTKDEFRADVHRTKVLLERIARVEVIGYRAPTYSVVRDTLWALPVLLEEGYRYDSSIFPIVHDRYGIPGAPRFPWSVAKRNGTALLEFPISTVRVGGFNLPFVGGGYLRHAPQSFMRWAMQRVVRDEKKPVIVYIHPWEVDPDQPRIAAPLLTRWRHYRNLEKMELRLDRLLSEFRFSTVREVLGL